MTAPSTTAAPARRVRFERRARAPRWLQVVVPVVSVVAALLFGAVFLVATGHDPVEVYRTILRVSYTTGFGITDTLRSATPLILTGLAAAVAFRFKLYNIGGEGQLYIGAVAASGIALAVGEVVPVPVAVAAVVLGGAIGGMAWVAVPALARAYLGTSEIITSLMLNFVALYAMRYLIFGSDTFWRDPGATTFPQGRRLPENATFYEFGTTRVHLGLVIAVIAAVAVYLVVTRTRWGYRWRVFGDSPPAARYAGISRTKVIVSVLLISGALAGLAGAGEVAGRAFRLDPQGLAINLGYTGIIVAALARYNPLAVVPVAVLVGGLLNAGPALQSLPERVPDAISTILTAAILLFALGGELFVRYRLRLHGDGEAEAAPPEPGEPVPEASAADSDDEEGARWM
ncbi:ABC transporter permease [Egibacter rhizosphaerae]|uniref:ABC transporter permease n=1 Tax=Egibacter rhizosphaerae TaxID=1670831 RepID=A0A411YEW2_9ACTN|nr:ABC transporter permease [Egibacter rhizosphaerae]QBI19739.1 ABC transporter permease [Egibacter rhizosphaerae]